MHRNPNFSTLFLNAARAVRQTIAFRDVNPFKTDKLVVYKHLFTKTGQKVETVSPTAWKLTLKSTERDWNLGAAVGPLYNIEYHDDVTTCGTERRAKQTPGVGQPTPVDGGCIDARTLPKSVVIYLVKFCLKLNLWDQDSGM